MIKANKNTASESSKKPRKVTGGKGMMKGKVTGKVFGKEQAQPTPAQKKEGWVKKKRAQELAKAVLELAFNGKRNSPLKKQASEYFGIPVDELTVEVMLLFRQAEKAIQEANTPAFNAVMDRAYGRPKEKHEVTGESVAPLFPAITHNINFIRCDNTDTKSKGNKNEKEMVIQTA